METNGAPVTEVMEVLLGNKNNLHNNYQDFQGFLDQGGRIGLQHDPLLPGRVPAQPVPDPRRPRPDDGRRTRARSTS